MPLFNPPDISMLKWKGDIKGLNRALKDKDPIIVRDAAFALAEFGIYASIGLLIGLSSPEYEIRLTAYTCFAVFKGVGFIPIIVSLHDEQEKNRLLGLQWLQIMNDKRAIHPIGDCLLTDLSKNVRSAAATALCKFGGEQAYEYLLSARSELDSGVRSVVEEALTQIKQ